MYSRLRADLHLDYEPMYNEETSFANSIKWYEKWYQSHFDGVKAKKNTWKINERSNWRDSNFNHLILLFYHAIGFDESTLNIAGYPSYQFYAYLGDACLCFGI